MLVWLPIVSCELFFYDSKMAKWISNFDEQHFEISGLCSELLDQFIVRVEANCSFTIVHVLVKLI